MVLILSTFLALVFLIIILSWVWPPDSPWAPWWSIKDNEARAALKLANVSSSDAIYDLGSGTGKLLIIAAAEFGANGVGIEIDPLRALFSALMIRINRAQDKVIVRRKNFFDEDLSKATVIFVYLVPKALNKLLPKFKKELKKGTRIVSFRYDIDGLKVRSTDHKSNLRLYII